MSLDDQNRMLYVLHQNGVSRKNILFIMKDLKRSGIFDEANKHDYDDWGFIDEQAFWLFESGGSNEEKLEALKNIKIKQEEFEKNKSCQYLTDQESRIQEKRKELIEKGVIKPDNLTHQKSIPITTRYGRTSLHEAIAMKDIRLVEKYIKSGKYLGQADNNGHTAMEMAYYENYTDALRLFKKYARINK